MWYSNKGAFYNGSSGVMDHDGSNSLTVDGKDTLMHPLLCRIL